MQYSVYSESLRLCNNMGEKLIWSSGSGFGGSSASEKIHLPKHFQNSSKADSKPVSDSIIREMDDESELKDAISVFMEDFADHSNAWAKLVQTSSFTGNTFRLTTASYIDRIAKYSGAGPCCFIASILYLGRLQRRRPELVLNSRTLQRLLLVSVMTAVKYLEDVVHTNTLWAQIGQLPLGELNALELDFLFAIDFDLAVSPEDHARCAAALREFAARRRGSGRRSLAAPVVPVRPPAGRNEGHGPNPARPVGPGPGIPFKSSAAASPSPGRIPATPGLPSPAGGSTKAAEIARRPAVAESATKVVVRAAATGGAPAGLIGLSPVPAGPLSPGPQGQLPGLPSA